MNVCKRLEGTANKLAKSPPDCYVLGSAQTAESPLFSRWRGERKSIGGKVFSQIFPSQIVLQEKTETADELPIEPRNKICEKKASQHEFDGQVVAATKKMRIVVERLFRGFGCRVFGFLAPISCILWREFGDARRGCALDGVVPYEKTKRPFGSGIKGGVLQ